MILKIVLFLVGLAIVSIGWHEVRISYKYQEPVKMTCQQFLSAADKPAWVSVDDCVLYLGHYQSLNNKRSDAVIGMAVMVFPSVEAAEDDKTTTSVVLNISDSEKRNAIKENVEKLNALVKDKKQMTEKERNDRYLKLFEKGNLVLKEAVSNDDFDLLKGRLSAKHSTYEYSSLADKSSIVTGVLTMLAGLVLSGLMVFFFVKR